MLIVVLIEIVPITTGFSAQQMSMNHQRKFYCIITHTWSIIYTCSWRDKLIVLWILNRQAKIFLCTRNLYLYLWRIELQKLQTRRTLNSDISTQRTILKTYLAEEWVARIETMHFLVEWTRMVKRWFIFLADMERWKD